MSSPPSLEIKIFFERFDLEINFKIQENAKFSDILGAFEKAMKETSEFNDADKQNLHKIDCPQAEIHDLTGMNNSIENKPFFVDPENFVITWDQASQCYSVQNQGRCAIKLFLDKQYKMTVRPRIMTDETQREDLLFPIADSEIPLRFNIYIDYQYNAKRFTSYTDSLAKTFEELRNYYKIETLIDGEYVEVKFDCLKEGRLEMKPELDPITHQELKELPLLNFMIFKVSAQSCLYEKYGENTAVACSFDMLLNEHGRKEKDRLKAYIQKAHNLHMKPDSDYLAPFINVIQSSGSGKSKLAAELTLDTPSIYLTMSSGYPKESPLGELFLKICNYGKNDPDSGTDYAYESVVGMYLLLLKALLSDYLDALRNLLSVNGNNMNGALKQLYKTFVYGSLSGDELQLFKTTKDWSQFFVDTEKGKFSSVKGPSEKYLTIKVVSSACNKLLDDIRDLYKTHSPETESFPFVLIIDGAAYMAEESPRSKDTSRFRHFRRSVNLLGKNCKLVVLALVTDTETIDFDIDRGYDSLRSDSYVPKRLFHPFVISGNWDTLLDPQELIKTPLTYDTIVCSRMIIVWLSLGRPFWSSIKLDNVTSFAAAKIYFNGLKSGHAYLACWMIRVGQMIDPSYRLSKVLAKSHLATLYATEFNDKVNFDIFYPSEPALAIGARSLLSDTSLVKSYYETLEKFIDTCDIRTKRFSEVISADICLHVIGKAKKEPCEWEQVEGLPKICGPEKFIFEHEEFHLQATKEFVGDWVKDKGRWPLCSGTFKYSYLIVRVDEFVKTLYGAEIYEYIQTVLPESMISARLNTTHFMTSFGLLTPYVPKYGISAINHHYQVTLELLQALMMRGAGVMNTDNADLSHFIPICLKPETIENTKPEYSYIGFKVKKSKFSDIRPIIAKRAVSSRYLRCGQHDSVDCPDDCQSRLSDAAYSRILKNGLMFVHSMGANGYDTTTEYADDSDLEEEKKVAQSKRAKKSPKSNIIAFECSNEEYKNLLAKLNVLKTQKQANEISNEEYTQSKVAIKKEIRDFASVECPMEFRDQVDNFVFKQFDAEVYKDCKFIPDFYFATPLSSSLSVHVMFKKGLDGEISEKLTAIYSRGLDVFSNVLPSDALDKAKAIISKESENSEIY